MLLTTSLKHHSLQHSLHHSLTHYITNYITHRPPSLIRADDLPTSLDPQWVATSLSISPSAVSKELLTPILLTSSPLSCSCSYSISCSWSCSTRSRALSSRWLSSPSATFRTKSNAGSMHYIQCIHIIIYMDISQSIR
jgi:hypothetical protein